MKFFDKYSDNQLACGTALFIVGLLVLLVVISKGPAGISRDARSWFGQNYGSDWVVVQYAQDGTVINHWELEGTGITSEPSSDGIYFIDGDGNVVHLSGHYLFIQTQDIEASRAKYIEGR